MPILCPIHAVAFESVEQRLVTVKEGYRGFVRAILLVTKSACPSVGCSEILFSDDCGVVIDGVKAFPKDAELYWKKD